MNGQAYQLSRLVAYVRHFLKSGEIKDFPLLDYENLILTFIPQRKLFSGNSPYECHIVKNWLLELKKRHVKDIFLLINYSGNDPALAGFVNAEAQYIVTIYENKEVTYWVPNWEYDRETKTWTIYYHEKESRNAPQNRPIFDNPTTDFKKVLVDIEELAKTLGYGNFAQIFHEAYDLLDSSESPTIPEWMRTTIFTLDAVSLKLFLAASTADVFGGMGSWNDSPACDAYQKGLNDKYQRLSDELYKQIKKAIMYAVNN